MRDLIKWVILYYESVSQSACRTIFSSIFHQIEKKRKTSDRKIIQLITESSKTKEFTSPAESVATTTTTIKQAGRIFSSKQIQIIINGKADPFNQ